MSFRTSRRRTKTHLSAVGALVERKVSDFYQFSDNRYDEARGACVFTDAT